jgi:hypothetical protein
MPRDYAPPRELDPVTRHDTYVGMDPVTEYFFDRGWPLSPAWLCEFHGMRYHGEDGAPARALAIDGLVGLLVLSGACCGSEWFVRVIALKRKSPI